MKKISMMLLSILMIGILAACGPNAANDTSTNKQNDTTANQETNTAPNDETVSDENNDVTGSATGTDMNEKVKKLDFAEMDIEVEYSDNNEYEAEIKKNSTGVYKSEVEDELNNKYLKGVEAFDHLYPIVEKINVNADSTKDEVIDEVLKAFELDSNYKDIDIEITFHDGKKIKFENK